jgi:hypothetical protein
VSSGRRGDRATGGKEREEKIEKKERKGREREKL